MYAKKIILCGALAVAAVALTASGCAKKRSGEADFMAYTLSDVIMTQKGVNTYDFEFTADCSPQEQVSVYLTQNDRITGKDEPIAANRVGQGQSSRFSFSADLNLSEEYYLWVKGGEKQVMLPLTAPSMFPYVSPRTTGDGGAIFSFNYTYGVSWSSFCDPEGKAVYSSSRAVFDDTAVPVAKGINITENECLISASDYGADKYYYSVTTAKNGLLTIISSPVSDTSQLTAQFTSLSAGLDGDKLNVSVGLDEEGDIAASSASELQLVVKSGTGDEIYSCNSVFADNVATMSFDCALLLEEDLWYDISLAYRGSLIADVPKLFGGSATATVTSSSKDKINYFITDWRQDGAPEEDAALKLYFEHDDTKFADEFCQGYLVSLADGDSLTLTVTVDMGQSAALPQLVITGGDETALASANAVSGGSGSAICTLALQDVLTEAGKWYDIRLSFGGQLTELLKDSCIGYSDYSRVYVCGGREYAFREYNGMLKISYIGETQAQ